MQSIDTEWNPQRTLTLLIALLYHPVCFYALVCVPPVRLMVVAEAAADAAELDAVLAREAAEAEAERVAVAGEVAVYGRGRDTHGGN